MITFECLGCIYSFIYSTNIYWVPIMNKGPAFGRVDERNTLEKSYLVLPERLKKQQLYKKLPGDHNI